MTIFYLVSTELRDPYPAQQCQLIKQIRSELRSDMALVKVIPPLSKETYATADDLEILVLATRHLGETLFPMPDRPVDVYISALQNPNLLDSDLISSEELAILDWGEVSATPS